MAAVSGANDLKKEILWAAPGKQKERAVQGAWLTPEAGPSERERNGHNGECKAEFDCLSGDEEINFERRVLVTVGGPENWKDKIAGALHEPCQFFVRGIGLAGATGFGTRWQVGNRLQCRERTRKSEYKFLVEYLRATSPTVNFDASQDDGTTACRSQ
jgi:hypothetical protein